MALLSKGSSLISGGIWRRTLARRRRTGRGGGGGVSALQQGCAASSQRPAAQASFVAACGGGLSAALQQDACALSSPGREQPPVAQASSFVGCDALQHVAAGGGSLLPSMLLSFTSLCLFTRQRSHLSNHPQRSRDAVQTLI